MQIRTLDEANQALQPFVPLVAQLTGKGTTLDRIRPLMELLGNPQNSTRVVHIAGTSGKTSTAYYISALLTASGKRVGLTVSPHVDSVTERVQLNNQPLDETKFCQYLGEFLDVIEQLAEKPSYFELLYAFSFWVFQREGVDYAVVETGMGGLHDATNVANRADKLCIITDIGFDHMQVLGHTITEIATQKAGIIHDENPVIMYSQSTELNEVVEKQVSECHADLHMTTQEAENQKFGTDFALDIPEFQHRNWLLAYAAYRFLQQRDGLPELNQEQLRASQQVQVPARMDRRKVGEKTIVMDGAHNGQKMETFLASFQGLYPDAKPAVMIALKEGKEPHDVAPLLATFASKIIVTTFNTSQDLPAKSMDPDQLASIFREAGANDVAVEPDLDEAYRLLLESPGDVGLITGSFYLISQLRAHEEPA